jgi:DNA-directed RNA polymerase subunit RPC12/RpoP
MSIEFVCDRCGHRIEVDERFEGKHGKCKHCGHHLTVPDHHHPHRAAAPAVPAHEHTDDDPSLHLRPVEAEPPPVSADLLAPHAPLHVRVGDGASDDERRPKPTMVSDPDAPPLPTNSGSRWWGVRKKVVSGEYAVLDPYKTETTHSSVGPPPLVLNLPTMAARFLAGRFRTLRDWLYLVSVASLVAVLYGYILGAKTVMHLGIVAVIVANIGMFVVGMAYLIMLPFKDSTVTGLANLFPPYAVYYWVKHWHKMRRPVLKTLGSFVPILLAGTAYFLYEDAAVIEKEVEKDLSRLEKVGERLESKLHVPNVLPKEVEGPQDVAPADDPPKEETKTTAQPATKAEDESKSQSKPPF